MSSCLVNKNIAVIGCGNMGGALIAAMVKRNVVSADQVHVYDADRSRSLGFVESCGVRLLNSIEEALKSAQIIVIAVKPAVVREVLWSLAETPVAAQPLVISVAAGISVRDMRNVLGESWPIVRVMPNLPCVYGAGMSAYFLTKEAELLCQDSSSCADLNSGNPDVDHLFSAFGRVVRVMKEKELDAVTGLSGSGPAFAFAIIEALADGGVKMGLSRSVAQTLSAQTLAGAAQMVLESNTHPGQLKDMVASPAGTTIAGLHVLETGGLRGLLMSAVEASARRAEELSKE